MVECPPNTGRTGEADDAGMSRQPFFDLSEGDTWNATKMPRIEDLHQTISRHRRTVNVSIVLWRKRTSKIRTRLTLKLVKLRMLETVVTKVFS